MEANKNVDALSTLVEVNLARVEIAQLTAEVKRLRVELERVKTPVEARLNTELRVVSHQPELVDVRIEAPPSGSRVIGLTKGGCLIQTIWTKSQAGFIGAWMAYPMAPESVKEWLSQAWQEPKQREKAAL